MFCLKVDIANEERPATGLKASQTFGMPVGAGNWSGSLFGTSEMAFISRCL